MKGKQLCIFIPLPFWRLRELKTLPQCFVHVLLQRFYFHFAVLHLYQPGYFQLSPRKKFALYPKVLASFSSVEIPSISWHLAPSCSGHNHTMGYNGDQRVHISPSLYPEGQDTTCINKIKFLRCIFEHKVLKVIFR